MFTEKTYRCERCLKYYQNSSSLGKHVQYECGQEPKFACNVEGCKYISKRKDNLNSHIRVAHNITPYVHYKNCDACHGKYKNEATLIRHKKYECGRQFACHISGCKYISNRKDQLKCHLRTCHKMFDFVLLG